MLQLLSLFVYIQFFSILLWGEKFLNTNRKGDVAKTVVLWYTGCEKCLLKKGDQQDEEKQKNNGNHYDHCYGSDIGKSASDQYQSKGSSDTTGRKYEGYKHIDGKGR